VPGGARHQADVALNRLTERGLFACAVIVALTAVAMADGRPAAIAPRSIGMAAVAAVAILVHAATVRAVTERTVARVTDRILCGRAGIGAIRVAFGAELLWNGLTSSAVRRSGVAIDANDRAVCGFFVIAARLTAAIARCVSVIALAAVVGYQVLVGPTAIRRVVDASDGQEVHRGAEASQAQKVFQSELQLRRARGKS